MSFLTMTNANIDFKTWDLQWRSYITKEVLAITRKVELIGKKEFIVAAYNPDHKAFIVHVTAPNARPDGEVHPLKRTQIIHFKADKTSTKVLSKYTDFTNIFLSKLAIKFFKHTGINNHTIKLVNN